MDYTGLLTNHFCKGSLPKKATQYTNWYILPINGAIFLKLVFEIEELCHPNK